MPKKKITIYTDQYSYFSDKLREWLKSHGFEYEEKDVKEPTVADELFQVSEQYAVPVIVVGKKVILGFDEKRLEELLSN